MARFRTSGSNWEGRAWILSPALVVLAQQIEAVHPTKHPADGTVASKNHDANNPASDHRPSPHSGRGVVRALDAGESHENDAYVISEAIRASKDPRARYVHPRGSYVVQLCEQRYPRLHLADLYGACTAFGPLPHFR